MSSSRPAPESSTLQPIMPVSFLNSERPDFRRTISNTDLSHFNSAAPTLNNTPVVSRNPSPDRLSTHSEKSTRWTLPKQDLEASVPQPQHKTNYALEQLEETWMGIVIILCFFTSGLVDAVAFNSWNTFVCMQSGNTIFAALGIGGQPVSAHPQQYYKSLVAIAAFCLGTLFFNFMHRWSNGLHNQPTSRCRFLFVTSFFLQTVFILISAALVTVGLVSNLPFQSGKFSSGSDVKGPDAIDDEMANYYDLTPVALLSFQAAGQVCFSRILNLLDLPTIVVSALYHDFVANFWGTWHMWKTSTSFRDFIMVRHRRESKRGLSIIALFVGALVGGEMYKSPAEMAGALWMAAGLKAGMTLAFAMWKKDTVEIEDPEK